MQGKKTVFLHKGWIFRGRHGIMMRIFAFTEYDMKPSYKTTAVACYMGYVVQAIVNCLPPLLYTAYHRELGVSLSMIGLLITLNFCVQISVDLLSALISDRVGYRRMALLGEALAALGLVLLAVLPSALPNPYVGLVIGTVVAAMGAGTNEVIISPIIEALPFEKKTSSMALLHSFYCWGHVAVVLLSTLYFAVAESGMILLIPLFWATVPLITLILFFFVPIRELREDGKNAPLRRVIGSPYFLLLCILMLAAGASELGIAEWASFFAENALGVDKTVGDLLGPCLFAVLMGVGRVLFGILGERIDLRLALALSSALALVCYLIAALAANPIVALLGCAMAGLFVAILWPGIYSLAGSLIPSGGTAMFALFALAGDLGCTVGQSTVALAANEAAQGLSRGLLLASVYPAVLAVGALVLYMIRKGRAR